MLIVSDLRRIISEMFTGDGIIDDIAGEKGIDFAVSQIPEKHIAALAKYDTTLWSWFVPIIINKLTPKEHRERINPLLSNFTSRLAHRVEEHRKEKGIETINSTSPAPGAHCAPTLSVAQVNLFQKKMDLLLDEVWGARGTVMIQNLASMLMPTGNVNYDNNSVEYTARLKVALGNLSDSAFINLLEKGDAERNSAISFMVGAVDAPKKPKSLKDLLLDVDHASDAIGIDSAKRKTRLAELDAKKTKREKAAKKAAKNGLPPKKKSFWHFSFF